MGPVLLAMIAGTLGFALGALGRRAAADALLAPALQAMDAAERDVAHWRQRALYWKCRAEYSTSAVEGDRQSLAPHGEFTVQVGRTHDRLSGRPAR